MEEKCIYCGVVTDHRVGGPDGTEVVCRKHAKEHNRTGVKDFKRRGCFGRFARARKEVSREKNV